MQSGTQSLVKDLFLRTAGLGLIGLALLAVRHLYLMENLPPVHQASPAEMALAAIAFLSVSAGVALAALGKHIFDRVEISARWASRPPGVRSPFSRSGRSLTPPPDSQECAQLLSE